MNVHSEEFLNKIKEHWSIFSDERGAYGSEILDLAIWAVKTKQKLEELVKKYNWREEERTEYVEDPITGEEIIFTTKHKVRSLTGVMTFQNLLKDFPKEIERKK